MSQIDARSIPHHLREKIRMRAIKDWKRGMRPSEMIAKYGVSGKSVHDWINRYEAGGVDGLRTRTGKRGTQCRLSPAQCEELTLLIRVQNPKDYGFETTLWTCRIIASVIGQKFGFHYSDTGVRTLLRRLNFTYQKPERRALQKDKKKFTTG